MSGGVKPRSPMVDLLSIYSSVTLCYSDYDTLGGRAPCSMLLKLVSSCFSGKTIRGSLCIGTQCLNFNKYCKELRDTESTGRILVLYFVEHLKNCLPLYLRASVGAVFCNMEFISLSHRYPSVYSARDDWIGVLAAGPLPFFPARLAQFH